MAGALRYSGRVAIVTGAGGGLGREYALSLAERGASVVVNDLGGSRSGEGKSVSAADQVVQEIRAKGGKAVPDYNSVEEGEKIVKTAIDNYGRIDILINNAGILRDKSFANMTEADWDLVHKVHLRGSFMVTKAAWPHFRKQNYGRIIMTASGAGIYGNFGQSNYSSAKLGLLGLSNTLAIEGAKYNIHCNTIIPVAASRLTQDVFPPQLYDQLNPRFVCPVVLWLCHESNDDNGGVFEAAGGWVGKYQWQRSIGKAFIPPTNLTVESVRDNWDIIKDMEDANSPITIHEQMALLIESLSGQTAGPPPKKQKTSSAIDKPGSYAYTQDSPILYALAVGTTTREPDFLNFLYENSDDFRVLPSFGTIIVMPAVFNSPSLHEQMNKLNADPSKLLHGEQYLELYSPLPSSGVFTSDCRVIEVLDKGSGAVAIVEANTFNESGQKVMYSQWSVFLVGSGNFGGKRTSTVAKSVLPPPSRQPDSFIQEKTSESQAALYRLCGDKNPMHIDPAFAAIGGFSQPILHGLCSLGYATRHVLKQYANNDVTLFKSVMARFASPILPGHTIRTEMWKEGNRIHFQSICVETGKTVISGAYIDLKGSSGPTVANPNLPQGDLQCPIVFTTMAERLQGMPDVVSKVQAVFEWNITKNGKTAAVYTMDLQNPPGRIINGTVDGLKPGCTLILEDDDLMSMVTGKLDAQKAFMSGKLKLKGNIMLTQKLKPFLSMQSAPSGHSGSGSGSPPSNGPSLKSDKIFVKLGERLKKAPDLASSIGIVYQWNILKDGKHLSTWTLDLKNGEGAVYKGTPKADKPDCTFILEDDLFANMMEGKADPQRAFMTGKLKITGDVLASQKLQAIWENPRDEEPENNASFETDPNSPTVSSPATDESKPKSNDELASLKSDFVFQIFAERLIEEPELAKKMKVVYNWNILKSGKKVSEWTVDLKTGTGSIYRGPPQSGKADVTISMDDEDVIQLMLGKLNPQRAFMTGRLKIKGNIMLTQKLNQLWQEILKSGRAVELPILSVILADKPFDPSLRSELAFVELGKRISRMPELVTKVKSIFEWNVTKDGDKRTQWILDLKNNKGMLCRGPNKGEKATCVITIDDDTFADWMTGKITGNQLVSAGKLKVDGDSKAVSRLIDSFKPQAKL